MFRIWRALLSLLTVFGGHFKNRRLDRVVLFGTLLLCAAVANFAFGLVALQLTGGVPRAPPEALQYTPLLIVIVAIASAVMAFRDAPDAVNRMPLARTMTISGASGPPAISLELRDLLAVERPRSGPIPDGVPATEPADIGKSAITWRPMTHSTGKAGS